MRFFHRSIIKDSATLLSGNVWAQTVSFAAYLLLTRLFSPDDFAVYNIFYSYIEIFIILSTCKYELSIVLADNNREAASLARLSLRLNAWVSALLLGVVLLLHFAFPETRISKLNDQFGVSLLIPVMVFFCGTSRVYTFLFNRFRNFKQIALSEIITSTSGVLLKILFGLARPLSMLHAVGLPLGTVLGRIAGNINYKLRLRKLELPTDISNEEVRQAAKKHRNFPCFTMPKDLMNSISYNLPFLWLALYFDKAEIGLFSLALTFTLRPINLFNNAFEKALYVRVSERVRAGLPVGELLRKFVMSVNAVAVPVMALLFFFAEPLFGFLFGGKWSGCGYYVRCLLPWVLVSLTSTSLMFISNVFSRQRTEFYFYVGLLLLRVGAIAMGIVAHDFQMAILLFGLSGMLVSLALLIWYAILVTRYDNGTISPSRNE